MTAIIKQGDIYKIVLPDVPQVHNCIFIVLYTYPKDEYVYMSLIDKDGLVTPECINSADKIPEIIRMGKKTITRGLKDRELVYVGNIQQLFSELHAKIMLL